MDIENKDRSVAVKGEGVGRGMEWDRGVKRDTSLYKGWINNKVLLIYNIILCDMISDNNTSLCYIFTIL